jgi:Condensation domain
MEKLIYKLRQSRINIDLVNDQLKLNIPESLDATEIVQEVIQHKQELISYIKRIRNGADAEVGRPQQVNEQATYDVFHQQKKEYLRFLVLGAQAFNMNFVLSFENPDRAALEKAVRTIVQRHESLRTTYLLVNGKMQQSIHPVSDLEGIIEYIDLVEKNDKEEVARALFESAVNRRFDFEKELPVDIKIVHFYKTTSFLCFTIHHASCDSVSREILEKETRLLYDAFEKGEENPLPALKLQYKDYAIWANNYLKSEKGTAARTFYKQKLSTGTGHSYKNELEKELLRASVSSKQEPFTEAFGTLVNLYPPKGSRYNTYIQEPLLNKIKKLAVSCGSSLNMTLTAAFVILLHKVHTTNNIRLYLPFSTRAMEEFEGIVGWLTSEVIVSIDVAEDMTVKELVDAVTAVFLETSAHRVYPHEAIMNDLDIPLYILAPAFLNFVKLPHASINDFTPTHDENGSGHFNFRCGIMEYDNGIEFIIHYNLRAYSKDKIVCMMERFIELLEHITASPQLSIKTYSLPPC